MDPTHVRTTGVLAPFAASLVLALPASSAPRAPGARAEFAVGATVLARAAITEEASPAGLEVTPADVARGYVDVRRATHLTIANTSPYGYALDVWPAAPVFREVEILGFGADVRLGNDGGAIVARRARGASLPLLLDFRFTLAPGLAPGRYPWPLRFQVRPLLEP
jgi:hypothetical protein